MQCGMELSMSTWGLDSAAYPNTCRQVVRARSSLELPLLMGIAADESRSQPVARQGDPTRLTSVVPPVHHSVPGSRHSLLVKPRAGYPPALCSAIIACAVQQHSSSLRRGALPLLLTGLRLCTCRRACLSARASS